MTVELSLENIIISDESGKKLYFSQDQLLTSAKVQMLLERYWINARTQIKQNLIAALVKTCEFFNVELPSREQMNNWINEPDFKTIISHKYTNICYEIEESKIKKEKDAIEAKKMIDEQKTKLASFTKKTDSVTWEAFYEERKQFLPTALSVSQLIDEDLIAANSNSKSLNSDLVVELNPRMSPNWRNNLITVIGFNQYKEVYLSYKTDRNQMDPVYYISEAESSDQLMNIEGIERSVENGSQMFIWNIIKDYERGVIDYLGAMPLSFSHTKPKDSYKTILKIVPVQRLI